MVSRQLIITILFAFAFPITSAAIISYLERKIMAWMQDRAGPLHTGPHGSLQLFADIGKMYTKEDALLQDQEALHGLIVRGWGNGQEESGVDLQRLTRRVSRRELDQSVIDALF